MDMKITGTLTYSQTGKCLFLTHVQGGTENTTPLIWPAGTRPFLRSGKRGVRVPGRGPIMEGDRVEGGGGGVGFFSLSGGAAPPGCLSAEKSAPVAITQSN
ncbi:hypothetical protein GCM10009560_50520 [Nonomuraea longicatena]|uniref:Uncharacterized protein n=2 Tax=Nonomuraea longicatena TaxID=83682 RepID=A0ABN1Q9R5_9ACTN